MQCVVVGNSRQQKHEAAGHMVSTLRKQKMLNARCSAPLLLLVRIPCVGNGPAQLKWISSSVNTIKITPRWQAQRLFSQVIRESVKLTTFIILLLKPLTQTCSSAVAFCLYFQETAFLHSSECNKLLKMFWVSKQ